jgi:hypothetical protein
MKFLTTLFTLCILGLSLADDIVPGKITVDLYFDADVQVCAGQTVAYAVKYENVPFSDPTLGKTMTEVEIRGSKPGGPRGFIGMALSPRPLGDFVDKEHGLALFRIPKDYAGYTYFFRPNVCFSSKCDGSSNFRNAGSSKSFQVINCDK